MFARSSLTLFTSSFVEFFVLDFVVGSRYGLRSASVYGVMRLERNSVTGLFVFVFGKVSFRVFFMLCYLMYLRIAEICVIRGYRIVV